MASNTTTVTKPIQMVLYCPRCHKQHVDEINLATGWMNPPHRSHECQGCGFTWRPADVATEGVARIKTAGQYDGKFNVTIAAANLKRVNGS